MSTFRGELPPAEEGEKSKSKMGRRGAPKFNSKLDGSLTVIFQKLRARTAVEVVFVRTLPCKFDLTWSHLLHVYFKN